MLCILYVEAVSSEKCFFPSPPLNKAQFHYPLNESSSTHQCENKSYMLRVQKRGPVMLVLNTYQYLLTLSFAPSNSMDRMNP